MNSLYGSITGFFTVALIVLTSGRLTAQISTSTAVPAIDPKLLEAWGGMVARDKELSGIEISDQELAAFLNGFVAGGAGRPAPLESPAIFPDVERVARARRDNIIRQTEKRNESAARDFFEKLNRNTNIVALKDGVRLEILESGRRPFPKPPQTVSVHYLGRLLDGTEFAQMGPLDLILVTNREVCRGWTEALQRIGTGGRMKLYVPPPLSEAEAFRRGIEPGSAMVFETELLGVTNTSPEDIENSLLPPAPEPEPPPPSGYSDIQIIETWGWEIARQIHADQCGLSQPEVSLVAKGLAAGIRSESRRELISLYPRVKQFVFDRREQTRLRIRRQRLAEMESFFIDLKKNTNVIALPDGLRYEILKPGSGSPPKTGEIVIVDYTAQLLNGTVIDKTYNEPLHIEVGSVIDGWNEGIQKIGKGGRIKLYIPPTLGYGDEDRSGVVSPIPANSTLIYDIELLDVEKAAGENAVPGAEQK